MAETHELRLKIDASAAKRGSRDFTSAIAAVKAAVKDLDRQADGTFSKLARHKPQFDVTPLTRATTEAERLATATTSAGTASDRAADNIRKMAIQSANALRVSTDQASRLRDRLLSVGDTAGLSRLEAGLDNLRSSLISATSGLDIREARAGYADLASELNRTAREAERLNAISIAAARAEEDAAAAAQSHGAALERLRAAHDPLFASSKRYETALREIQQLEDAGAMSAASAAQARDRAAQSMLAAGSAANAYAGQARVSGHETAYMAAQLNDVGVMLASGQSPLILAVQQGTQISQMLNQIGGKASILATLRAGFISMVNPVSLSTIAIIAGGAALGQWAISAMDSETAAESFKRQLDALATASGDMQQSIDLLQMSALELAEKYGTAAQRVRELAIAQAELRMGEIRDQLKEQVAELGFIELRYRQAQGAAALYSNGITNIARDFKISRQEAISFHDVLMRMGEATTFEEQRSALQAIVKHAQEAGIELSQFPTELRDAAIAMIDLSNESDAMEELLRQAQDAISGNTSATDNWASAMSGVREEINAIGSALANIGGGVIDNAAKQAELTALQAGKTIQQAAVARERYKKEAEWSAREATAGDGLSGWIQRQLIDVERTQWERGVSLDEQIAAAREAARKAARTTGSSGGSSRTSSLNEEANALDRLKKSVEDRVINLHNENAALELVASGQMENIDTARLMVDAMVANGGAIDSTTASLIAQFDAAQALNEALKEAARDPLKEWQDAVPSYQKIGNDIESALIGSVQSGLEGLMTGDFDLESWGDQILSSIASTVAPKATEELFSLTGLDQLIGGAGDWVSGLGGDEAQLASGGQVAGQTIAQAMTTAGSTVAQQIAQAMGTGGSQAAVQQQTAIMQGGAQAASQSRTAGVQNAAQLRTASTQGGQQLARGVVSGSQQGATILAQGAAGGGGGIFSTALSAMGFGDVGSAITTGLSLFGFAEGGYSDGPGMTMHTVAPSAFQNAPHFAQGTANTSGIPAVLHPNEAVIPLSKGRKVPVEMGGESVGGRVFNQTINQTITTPDADSFRKSKKQIANELHRAGSSAARSLS